MFRCASDLHTSKRLRWFRAFELLLCLCFSFSMFVKIISLRECCHYIGGAFGASWDVYVTTVPCVCLSDFQTSKSRAGQV